MQTLQHIHETEKQADALVLDAHNKASALVADGKDTALQALTSGKEDVLASRNKAIASLESDLEKESEKQRKKVEKQAAALHSRASSHKKKVLSFLMTSFKEAVKKK